MAFSKKKISYIIFVLLLTLVVISIFYRLPYYVMQPGDAHDLDPVIDVEGGHDFKNGDFLFMTVQVVQPNIYQYAFASFKKYRKILPIDQLRQEGENQKEYNTRQLYYMDNSQLTATYVAYERAGKNPKIIHHGVEVVSIIDGMPAEKKLQLGDMIVDAAGEKIKTPDDLLQVLKGKTKGDSVKLTVLRDDKEKQLTVSIGHFPQKVIDENKNNGVKNPKKYGMGITQVANLEMKVDPSVSFHTEKIGGPSGGLMFTLDIYNQLTETNWTKGYKIAGTGTMQNLKGEVGPIGGIKEKIVAADAENVEIFFAPQKANNYTDAVATAKDIDTDMKIVPVKTLDDALNYLKKLHPKNDKTNNEAA